MAGLGTSAFASRSTDPLEAASGWVTGLIGGSLAIGLCVLAVAFVGMMMLSGRVDVRVGLRVVLGCFVLLGAPVIVSAFIGASTSGRANTASPPVATSQELNPRDELPPSDYDPYAGASLKSD